MQRLLRGLRGPYFVKKPAFLPVADSGALILFEGAQNEAKLVS